MRLKPPKIFAATNHHAKIDEKPGAFKVNRRGETRNRGEGVHTPFTGSQIPEQKNPETPLTPASNISTRSLPTANVFTD